MPKFFRPSERFPKGLTHILTDFDGVMTDNSIYTDNTGNESVRCSKWDSTAMWNCMGRGFTFTIVSREPSLHVRHRAFKLGIECHQAVSNKKEFAEFYCIRKGIKPINCAYIGNDIADIEVMNYVNFSACPSDSHPDVLGIADHKLFNKGGDGAIREFCDKFLTGEIV